MLRQNAIKKTVYEAVNFVTARERGQLCVGPGQLIAGTSLGIDSRLDRTWAVVK